METYDHNNIKIISGKNKDSSFVCSVFVLAQSGQKKKIRLKVIS